MLGLFQGIFTNQVDAVFAVLILLPVLIMLIMLSMCVVYFLFDMAQHMRRRRPM